MYPLSHHYYRAHYPAIQHQKYEGAWQYIQPYLSNTPLHEHPYTLLDMGVGPAWLEAFLLEKGLSFTRMVGVDLDEERVSPRLPRVEYILGPGPLISQKFDLVVSWDAWHCFPEHDLLSHTRHGGLLLVAETRPFESTLNSLLRDPRAAILEDAWVGEQEKSRVILIRKK